MESVRILSVVSPDCPPFGPALLGLILSIDSWTVMCGRHNGSLPSTAHPPMSSTVITSIYSWLSPAPKVFIRYSRRVKTRDNVTQRLRFLNRFDSTSPRGQMMRRHHLAIHGGEATANVSEPALGHSKMMIQCSAERITLSSRLASNGGGWRRL